MWCPQPLIIQILLSAPPVPLYRAFAKSFTFLSSWPCYRIVAHLEKKHYSSGTRRYWGTMRFCYFQTQCETVCWAVNSSQRPLMNSKMFMFWFEQSADQHLSRTQKPNVSFFFNTLPVGVRAKLKGCHFHSCPRMPAATAKVQKSTKGNEKCSVCAYKSSFPPVAHRPLPVWPHTEALLDKLLTMLRNHQMKPGSVSKCSITCMNKALHKDTSRAALTEMSLTDHVREVVRSVLRKRSWLMCVCGHETPTEGEEAQLSVAVRPWAPLCLLFIFCSCCS